MKIRLAQLRQIIKEEIQRSQASNLQEFGYNQKYLPKRKRPEVKAKPLPAQEKTKSYAMKLPSHGGDEDEDKITIGVPLYMLDKDDFDKLKVGDDISRAPEVKKFAPVAMQAPISVILGGYDEEEETHIGYATFDVRSDAVDWFLKVLGTSKDEDDFDSAIVTDADVDANINAAKTDTTTESIKRLRRLIRGYT